MSVLYRALWTDPMQDDVAKHLDDLKLRCAAWATESAEPEPLLEGKAELSLSLGRRRQIDHRALVDEAGRQGFELVTRDQKDGEATVWAAVIRVVADAAGVHSLIENRMESDDLAIRAAVGRPKVVHCGPCVDRGHPDFPQLLARAGDHRAMAVAGAHVRTAHPGRRLVLFKSATH